jgi:hypothetical protein
MKKKIKFSGEVEVELHDDCQYNEIQFVEECIKEIFECDGAKLNYVAADNTTDLYENACYSALYVLEDLEVSDENAQMLSSLNGLPTGVNYSALINVNGYVEERDK